MSISRTVSLDCDGTSQYCEAGFEGNTVKEVRAEARAAGWTLGGIDLCPECHPRRMAEREEEDRADSVEMYRARREEAARMLARPCPTCTAGAGQRCVTASGKPIGNPWQSHAARVRADGM